MRCDCCPRRCAVDRSTGETGFCGAGPLPYIARIAPHLWEEPCISGSRGSGAVFFAGCNLRCIFCQNAVLRDAQFGRPYDAERLSDAFLSLQAQGVHNINLVTPTPHLAVIADALMAAKRRGLCIPVVYNTNGYETIDALERLNGLVDIYLPDFKYLSPVLSRRFSLCEDYGNIALPAILEMHRQVGTLETDQDGIAVHGLLIRHLVLPACVDDSRAVLDCIAEHFPVDTHLSLMRQYAPTESVTEPPLNRRVTDREYDRLIDHCFSLGLANVWIQEKSSADLQFTPEFTNWK